MEFTEALNRRRSIRSFSDQPVTREDVETIVAQAQRTPSWANSQPWKAYIAIGDAAKAIREEHLRLTSEGVPSNAVWASMHRTDWQAKPRDNMINWSKEFHANLNEEMWISKEANQHLYNAQAIVYLAIPKNATNWSHYDLGGFGATLMLAASNLGIDSMAAYEFIMYPDRIREIMDVDPEYDVVMGMGLGYRTDDQINQLNSSREPLEAVLTVKESL